MKPRQFAFLLLLFLLAAHLGQAQTQTFGVTSQQVQPVQYPHWDIYWKNGSAWERSGGLGTVSIRDNLKLLATHDGQFPGEPENESNTICFQSEGQFALSNCLDLGECPFFVVEQRAVDHRVWGPKHCATSDPGFISE